MSRAADLAFFKLLSTSGIDLITQMPVMSECLKRLVPSFSLSMIRVDERCAPQQHYSEHFDDFSHQLFAGSGHAFAASADDPAAFGRLLRNRRPYGALVDTPPEYLAGATYQHLFRRNGIHHCLDVALRDANGPLGILGIFREEKAPRFSRDDVAVIAEIYPHLVHACATPPRDVAGGGLDAPHDEVEGALLIVDLDGAIRWASPQARAWLEDATPGPARAMLMVGPARLPEACRFLCEVWKANARPTRTGRAEVPTVCLPLPGGRLRLRAFGLAPEGDAGGRSYVGIQLTLEMNRALRVLRALERSALTPQQRRIALAYWQGRTPNEVQALVGVSRATLKSYLKELYARLDVTSADELVEVLGMQARDVTFDLRRHLPRRGAVAASSRITPSGG